MQLSSLDLTGERISAAVQENGQCKNIRNWCVKGTIIFPESYYARDNACNANLGYLQTVNRQTVKHLRYDQ
jgi:hypothetical protein